MKWAGIGNREQGTGNVGCEDVGEMGSFGSGANKRLVTMKTNQIAGQAIIRQTKANPSENETRLTNATAKQEVV